MKRTMDFEASMKKLEKIVSQLEDGSAPLDESIRMFEEGMELSTACANKLNEIKQKIEILVKKNGTITAEPFDEGDSSQ